MNTATLPLVSEKDARIAFKNGDAAQRKLLQDLWPTVPFDFEKKLSNIKEWVKTWDDVCEAYLMLPMDQQETQLPETLPYAQSNPLKDYINGCWKVAITNYLFNGGKIPDICDGKTKYWIWWDYDHPGFRFSVTYDAWATTDSTVGPRLCFYDRETAAHVAKILTPIYAEMYAQPKSK